MKKKICTSTASQMLVWSFWHAWANVCHQNDLV